MTRAEIIDVLTRMDDYRVDAVVSLLMGGLPVEDVMFQAFLFARRAWLSLEERIAEERDRVLIFLKSGSFMRDDPYVVSMINALEAGSPVTFTLLQGILLLASERARMMQELIALSERMPPSAVVVKDGRPWPQSMPEPPDVLFYEPVEGTMEFSKARKCNDCGALTNTTYTCAYCNREGCPDCMPAGEDRACPECEMDMDLEADMEHEAEMIFEEYEDDD